MNRLLPGSSGRSGNSKSSPLRLFGVCGGSGSIDVDARRRHLLGSCRRCTRVHPRTTVAANLRWRLEYRCPYRAYVKSRTRTVQPRTRRLLSCRARNIIVKYNAKYSPEFGHVLTYTHADGRTDGRTHTHSRARALPRDPLARQLVPPVATRRRDLLVFIRARGRSAFKNKTRRVPVFKLPGTRAVGPPLNPSASGRRALRTVVLLYAADGSDDFSFVRFSDGIGLKQKPRSPPSSLHS